MDVFNLSAEICVEVNAEVEAETLEEAQEIFAKNLMLVDYCNETVGVEGLDSTVRWGRYDIDASEVMEW